MEFENDRKHRRWRKLLIWLLLLIPFAGASVYAGMAYAKYQSTISKEGSATVAKWAFATDNTAEDITIDFSHTYSASTLKAGKIAPGTSGQFTIQLNNEHTEVGVSYKVTVELGSGAPANLKLYTDSAHTTALTAAGITGTMAPEAATPVNVVIYWLWAYETEPVGTNDPVDTTDGVAAATFTATVSIVGTQVKPAA